MMHNNFFVEDYLFHQVLRVMNDCDSVVVKVVVVVEYKNYYPETNQF
jgi:hypothetical protein